MIEGDNIRRFFRIFFKTIIIIFALLLIAYIFLYIYAKMSPKLNLNSANVYYLYDSSNELYTGSNDKWVSIDDISKYLIDSTISIEDKNFYKHNGFDILRIIKAMVINIKSGKTKQGASTITQQYAKNLFLDFNKTWKRKIDEAWITLRLEAHYTKNELLEGYLNTINYGGIYGIENASYYYFGKSAKELDLAESTILAGIPKSPSNYSPISNYDNAKKRQLLILNSMVKNGYITEEEKTNAYNEELTFIGEVSTNNLKTLMYFQDAVIDELKTIKEIPSSFLTTGGLKIYTTLDMNAQKSLEKSIDTNLSYDKELQVSAMLMDPNNGEIKAIAGGKDYSLSQYNRVTSSKRQVGSTMKPFLYYSALESGFTPSTTFTSEKTTFTFSGNKTYSPKNYGDLYANKEISLASALAFSDNIYAVKTNLFLGEDVLVNFASRIGISNNLEAVPSLALGTNEINIKNMMQGYATFASEGKKIIPHYIKKVTDINGNVLYEYKQNDEILLNKSTVYILNELLSNCTNEKLVDYTTPTCLSIKNKLEKKYAIKTGTTDTDHWIFGYNKNALLGIWVGYDDNHETDGTPSRAMKYTFADAINEYEKDMDNTWYEKPNNVVGVLVDPISGKVADESTKNATIFYYLKGTQPNRSENYLEETFKEVEENNS